MTKCLVTKLNGSVSNSELLRIGETRLHFNKTSNPTSDTQGFNTKVSNPVKLEIIGDGYFTDKTLAENKGKTLELTLGANNVFVSNNDLDVAILNKYDLSYFSVINSTSTVIEGFGDKWLNIDDLSYSLSMTSLNLQKTLSTGNIGSL